MIKMLKFSLALTILPILTLRCSHTADFKSITPPYASQVYSNLEEKDPGSVEIHLKPFAENKKQKDYYYWANFKLGQIWSEVDPKKACSYFMLLAEDKDFPLKELAYLKEIEHCELNEAMVKHLFELDPEDLHKWLRIEIYELRYKVAKEQGLHEELAEAAHQLSRQSVIRNEKIDYTLESLEIAKKLKDKKRIDRFQTRLEKLSPSRKKVYKKSEYFRIAYDLRRDREFDKAIEIYKKIALDKSRSFEERIKAWQGVATTHKLNRDKEKHIKALFSVASLSDKNYRKNKTDKVAQRIFHDTMVNLSRALWTQGQVSKARNVLETLAKWLKGKYPIDQVYWLIARMEEERTNFKEATKFAQQSIEESSDESSYKEKSLWILAWNQKKLGDNYKAIDSLKSLIEITENEYDKMKYKFWLAHTYQKIGDKVTAYQAYKSLGEEDPLGYYGLLSYRQRGEEFPPILSIKEKTINNLKSLDLKRDLISQLQWLIAVDELKLAQNYLKQLRVQIKNQKSRHDLYHLYIQAGHYAGVFSSLASLPPDEKRDLVEQNPSYLFPRPYKSVIDESAREFGVDPALIYSIIRQESSFIPHARSFADAFGLMQLIPKQAKRLAKKYDVNYKKTEDLYKPYLNVPLGTAFLRELWDRKKGQFIVTAASYNASEKAVLGWINTRYFGDPIVFIEDIPYSETKGYVKLVLRNYIWYSRLEVGAKPYRFPEWALSGLEDFKKKK